MEENRNENIFQAPPEYQSRLSSRSGRSQNPIKKVLIILIFIVILGVILFGAFRLISGDADIDQTNGPTPTLESFPTNIPTETEDRETTPTPTEAADDDESGLDRGDLSIHILNGSGVSGASSKASDYLEGLGYNVIQIGNAENFDYDETEIKIKASQDEFLEQLEADLVKEYTVGSTTTNLSENETPDAIVIIGTE